MQILVNCICAFTGALGYGIIFNIRGKNLFFAALGGFLSYLVLSFSSPLFSIELGRFFLAAAFVSFYSECMAMIRKVPVTTFLVTSMIPLVPGGRLFYTMQYFILGEINLGAETGIYALEIAATVAMGILLMSFVVKSFKRVLRV